MTAILLSLYRERGPAGATDDDVSRLLSVAFGFLVTIRAFTPLRDQLAEDGVISRVGDRWVWTGGIQ